MISPDQQTGSRKVEPLTGPQRLAAFGELPPEMQAGAFLALRRTIEERREREREG